MLELLSPAGGAEAVIAAVQNGADTVYMGYGVTDAERDRRGFSADELSQCLRYCRVRGCRTAVAINELISDDSMTRAVERARFAAEHGADALLVQDIGLVSVLREALPDMPLWGGVRLGIHSVDGALAAAALGLERVLLTPELTLEQIRQIAENAPIPVGVLVHGPLCFAYMGQCYMSAMNDRQQSDSCIRCGQPCREKLSLGGRMDDRPMSMADVCLINHLEELEKAGVSCAVIGGRSRRAEYVAYVTRLYARALKEKAMPTEEEMGRLRELFAANGLTDGYFTGEKGPDMFGVPQKTGRAEERAFAELRKGYMESELRRVPVKFYVVIQQGKAAMFAAEDDKGHRAAYQGYAPIDLGRQGISAARVREVLYRTGGTPYNCVDVQCVIDPGMDYADEALEEARRALLAQIAEQTRRIPAVRQQDVPDRPQPEVRGGKPALIVQVSKEEQLSEELARAEPDYLYVPAEVLAAGCTAAERFREKGTRLAAVLPRIVTDAEKPVLRELLATLRGMGIHEVVGGSLGLIPIAREMDMTIRGDYGLNLCNSWAVQRLGAAGLASVTASFQLSAKQIRALSGAVDTEMIVYGRVPVMITEHCLIHNSSGRCSCSTPTSMSDPFGSVYPVEKEFGCRNVVYDGKKIFLADRPDVYENAGLWAVRLMFTTESARECAAVAGRYRGQNHYRPNNTSRGLYPKGALWI